MFARIAPRYDLLNHLLSLGIDRRWRKAVIRRAGELDGRLVLDACTGTGDLALAFAGAGARVVGADFTHEMLRHAARKARADRPVCFVGGDTLRLPLGDGAVDVSTVAFGIRNVADRAKGLAELARVVRPGGLVLVLEFSMPTSRFPGALYRLYFTRLLPRIGGWLSGDSGAYRYLPDTVLAWPDPAALAREMEGVGLVDCGWRRLSSGIACLSWGRVP